MTYHNATFRSAVTAIAAVLAAPSTPLFAQDAGVLDPVPETTSEPVTATPDPLAPEPAAPEAPVVTPVVTDTADQPAKASKPVAKAKAAARPSAAAARPSATRTSAATTSDPVTIAAPAAGELIDASVAPPVEAAPPSAPTPVETASVDQAQEMDNMLELAGAAGAGLLVLAGAGIALRSRKRRKEEEQIEEAKWAYIEASPDPESQAEREPAFTRAPTPMHDPVPAARMPAQANRPATQLPDGFDLSSFGPHVQAAYRGPTPDNPSVSLEYRLRRATFLDQKEQDAKEAATHSAAQAPARPAWAQPAQAARAETKFMLRRAGAANGAKPAFHN